LGPLVTPTTMTLGSGVGRWRQAPDVRATPNART
jgi:hypothetical protein